MQLNYFYLIRLSYPFDQLINYSLSIASFGSVLLKLVSNYRPIFKFFKFDKLLLNY